MKNAPKKIPYAYHLTFRTYGTWLHGDPRGSVDPQHNVFLTPRIQAKPSLYQAMEQACLEDIFLLNAFQRNTVLHSVINTCDYNQWHLHVAHVRSNHLHIVLQSQLPPNKTIGILKAYATKELKKCHSEIALREKFWSAGGSKKYIWSRRFLFPTMNYVIEGQGEKMAIHYEKAYDNVRKVELLWGAWEN